MKVLSQAILAILWTVMPWLLIQDARGHCQIPCGIYDDHARIRAMLEDVATIEKATQFIAELADKNDPQSKNQFVRWVNNKEKHAQNIIDTMSDYFLTQRVKTDQKDYSQRLARHHQVIVAAMKVKQNADAASVRALAESITQLSDYYPKQKQGVNRQ